MVNHITNLLGSPRVSLNHRSLVLAFPRKPDDPIELINAELDWYLAMLRQGYHPDEAIMVLARAHRDFDQRFWWLAWGVHLTGVTRL